MTLTPGTIVGGRHRIEELIGQGGFGAVFRATQLALDRPVALKVLLPEALGDGGQERFQREAAIVQRLEHPNIVRVLDFGVGTGGEPYLVFELLQGSTLEQVIALEGPLSPARAARVGTQVLKALMEAHARGIVHRDIKPANIFLCHFHGEPDFVKVLDFGVAKGQDSRTLTGRGAVVGTPAYMAPEQVNGSEAGFAADLFSLGLTLEEALTGKPVYEGLSLVDIVREHVSAAPVPHAASLLTTPLGPVIHRATLKKPEMRYPSAAEMLAHLEAAMSYATAVSRPGATPPGPPSKDFAEAPTALAPIHSAAATPIQDGGRPPPSLGPAGVLVPPAPPRRPKGASRPWVLIGAVSAVALTLAGIAGGIAISTRKKPAEERRDVAPKAAEAAITRFSSDGDGSAIEVDANGDATPDIVGICSDRPSEGAASLCAVEGAGFGVLWRRPLGVDTTVASHYRVSGAGRRIVVADPGGIAHIHEAATGKEIGAIRLGAKVDGICVPPDMPGKVWIKTKEPRGLLIDTAARSATDAARPASCLRGREEIGCYGVPDPAFRCVGPFLKRPVAGHSADRALADGDTVIAAACNDRDRSSCLLLGLTPLPPKRTDMPKVLWQQPIAPGGGPEALSSLHHGDFDLRAGRVVLAYDDLAGKSHVVVFDAVAGRRLWDVRVPTYNGLMLSATRLYLRRWSRLDAYDAATGKLLGGVGVGN